MAGPEVAQPWKFHSLAVAVSTRAQSLVSALQKELGVFAIDAADETRGRTSRQGRPRPTIGSTVDVVDNRRLFDQRIPRIGAAGAVDRHAHDHVARLQFRSRGN